MKRRKKRALSTSLEDYLEAIYVLEQKARVVRVKDISKMLEVSMPSVHQALHILMESGLVNHEHYGDVELTAKGRNAGREIYNRHTMLTKFFDEVLGVPREIAEGDACRIEHNISQETLDRLVAFIDFAEFYFQPRGLNWTKKFKQFFKRGKKVEKRMIQHRK
jgi:DtxR family Mn-dependent transcriptional regulator